MNTLNSIITLCVGMVVVITLDGIVAGRGVVSIVAPATDNLIGFDGEDCGPVAALAMIDGENAFGEPLHIIVNPVGGVCDDDDSTFVTPV